MDQFSEAQIILPEAVRNEASPVYDTLTEAYGWVKKSGVGCLSPSQNQMERVATLVGRLRATATAR
jgi:hypothetical protein